MDKIKNTWDKTLTAIAWMGLFGYIALIVLVIAKGL
jgi:hypothetical protein